jgi:iron complex transport system substrate-binding protein
MKMYWRTILLLFVLLVGNRVSGSCHAALPAGTVSFTDALGKRIEIAAPVKRIVVVNGDAAEILCALGAEACIVGISSQLAENFGLLSGLQGKTVVGSSTGPSLEKIIELQPDLVIAYEMWMTREAFEQKLMPAGISVARMYCYRMDRLDEEIRVLGRLVGKETEAETYILDRHRILNQIAGRLQGLETRVRAYLESYSPYQTVTTGAGGEQLLERAGIDNLAAALPGPWPQITNEWLVKENPELIIKAASTTYIQNGYGCKDMQIVSGFRDQMMRRPGWNQIRAVRENRLYLLSSEIYTGPRAHIGVLYMAKWAYPERFQDMDPEAVNRQWLMRWHDRMLKGIYAYP